GLGAALGGVVVLYAFGVTGMAVMLGKTWAEAALLVTAYLPGDAIKVVLAALITRGIAQVRPQALLSRG
ncbi:MAG: biotin transporter BioY, partial [Rhodobacterales bacterium]|nr:biotin transporter BioY [Rhodobacterales bacterium]